MLRTTKSHAKSHITSHHITSHQITSHHITSHHSKHQSHRHATLRHAMPRHAKLNRRENWLKGATVSELRQGPPSFQHQIQEKSLKSPQFAQILQMENCRSLLPKYWCKFYTTKQQAIHAKQRHRAVHRKVQQTGGFGGNQKREDPES